jgi:hypothetical protein
MQAQRTNNLVVFLEYNGKQSLDDYEIALGLIPVWVDIDKAIEANKKLMRSYPCQGWVPRETFMLEYVKERYNL